jgi:hypothetical protein
VLAALAAQLRTDPRRAVPALDRLCPALIRVVSPRPGGPWLTVNVPANAPHAFTNASGQPARLLCMCSPPGQGRFFLAVGQPALTRTQPPPALDEAAQAAFIARSQALAPQYRTELLRP